MFGRKNSKHEEVDTELNLIPIMNLFTALIPFLLLSAAFVQVQVITGSVPTIADGSDPVNEQKAYDKRPVVVNVQITNRGYDVTVSGDELSKGELARLATRIKKKKKNYNSAGLTAHLKKIKALHPKSDTVIIAPGQKIKYREIVRVMDASREIPGTTNGKKRYLFPKVVVASLHQ